MKLALCGNPNVGKTTLFNRLTRSDEPVGNWHGVTVDAREKSMSGDVMLSDLPGTYSLSARTAEEAITRDKILFGGYDALVYVAEVNNLRRNLYMFMQLVECGRRAVLVVNMMDEARSAVDLNLLSERLGVPVIGTSNRDRNPKTEMLAAVQATMSKKPVKPSYLSNPPVCELARKISDKAGELDIASDFAALKLMERDEYYIKLFGIDKSMLNTHGCGCSGCASCSDCDRDIPARMRYGYIDKILDGVMATQTVSKKTLEIDGVVLGKFALPIFLLVMSAVFVITVGVGTPLSGLLSELVAPLAAPIENSAMPEWISSLLADGIISGLMAVLAFLPQVVILFMLTALLQDSGYMSRVAFLTDGFFKKFGLSGRAAFSVVLGLGCSATAVLTTRGISGDEQRKRAAMATAFCPCSARLAVFTAIASYFSLSGFVVAAMYIVGFVVALAVLKVMQFIKKDDGGDSGLIMEMPPYRLPNVKRVLSVVLNNVLSFLWRIGSIVMVVSIIMWVLCNFSFSSGFTGGVENSIMQTVAGVIAPIFKPLGFGNWKAVTALVSGVAAKETVISVIAALGGMNVVLDSGLAAVSFMIFTGLYVPCIATLSALAKESGIKSAVISAALHTVIAYMCALIFYTLACLVTSI